MTTRRANLSPRRRRFVEAFVESGNARASAREAGYSDRSAHTTAWRLLNNVEVQRAIEVERHTLRARVQLDQDQLVGELLSLYQEARETRAYSAAARCLGMVAQMTGLDEPAQTSQAERVLKLLAERLPPPPRAKSLGDGS